MLRSLTFFVHVKITIMDDLVIGLEIHARQAEARRRFKIFFTSYRQYHYASPRTFVQKL